MITLHFDAEARALAEDCSLDPVHEDPAVLEETYFVVPVTFRVDGHDMLGAPGAVHPLPLLGFASHMLEALAKLGQNDIRQVSLAGGGGLRLRSMGPNVEVQSSLTDVTVVVSRQDAVNAFKQFASDVAHELTRRTPSFRAHPHWSTWFEGLAEDSSR